ncbi:NADH-quinone oxidoreductase subunit A, partial [bacterium]|nr:NADH-quinone oxidoreductase subunit A [bacterium]
YIPLGLMVAIGVLAGIVFTNVNRWLGPRRPSEEKLSTYESGMEPVRSARERFSVKFYLVAMLFLLFDIEVVFMYPWAVKFRELGVAGFVEMLIFIGVLLVGLLYVWKKGALRWQ